MGEQVRLGAVPVRHERVDTGAVTLDVEVAGDDGRPVALLISGLGSQRTEWPDELRDGLMAAGLRLVTFDNRDVGASTHLHDRAADRGDLARFARGEPFEPPYHLQDLAADAVAVLDHLDVPAVHVVGRSMGGMIGQHLAAQHPSRVASLTSMMSTTGATDVGQPWPEAVAALTAPTPETREEVIAAGIARARVTSSPTLFDEARVRARLEAAYDRAHHPDGRLRQLLAILADGDRTPLLRRITAPTLVLHGASDTLVDVSGGCATATAIDDARLVVFDDMGHDLPLELLPAVVGAIVAHVWQAEAACP